MSLRKPTPVVASEEKLAETTSRANQLLNVLLENVRDECHVGAIGLSHREGFERPREQLLELIKGLAARATYRVYVQSMRESHRVTYWTTVVSSHQVCLDSRNWHKGRITPYMSENFEQAEYEASNWAAFLGVEAEVWVKPEWHDALVAELAAKRLVAGLTSSGSHPEVGAKLEECAQEEAAVALRQSALWQPFASVPRDGSVVDVWDGSNRLLNVRYLRAEAVDARFAKGGCWEQLALHGFRRDTGDEHVLAEAGLTHWRYCAADRPFTA